MTKKIQVEYRVYDGQDALSRAAAEHFVKKVRSAVEARGVARIAISGGGSPKPVFALLADPRQPYRDVMPWDRLRIFWVDERCVPPDSPDSNYGNARDLLLSKVPLAPEHIVRIEGELDPEEGAARYEAAIRAHFRLEGAEIPIFDAIQLGMGDNAHTASLFPHTEALHETIRIAVANDVPEAKQGHRITLTSPVINAGREVFFLIQGADKAEPLKEVLLGAWDPETLPAQLIQPQGGRLLFLLDRAVARLLPAPNGQGTGHMEIAR